MEILTGTSPVDGVDSPSIIASHLFSPPRPFSESDPEGRIPDAVRQAILTALEKEPDSRYPDAESFGRALLGAAKEEIEASREPGGKRKGVPPEPPSAARARAAPCRRKPRQRLDAFFRPHNERLYTLLGA